MKEGRRCVLVTGATGFLGARVAAQLLARGLTVRLLHRPGREHALELLLRAPEPGRAQAVAGDVTDRASLERAAAGCDAVIHAAALVTRSAGREDFERVNVGGLRNLLDAARSTGVERVVYTSSFFALGPSDPRPGMPGPAEGVAEDALQRLQPELDGYQHAKHRAALLAAEESARGAPLLTLYPGVLVGPGAMTEGNFVTSMIVRHLQGRLVPLPDGGRRRWSFVHVDDAAAAHVSALERGRLGAGYVVGGQNRTLRDLFDVVARLTGAAPPWLSAPHPVPWLVGLGEEAIHALTGVPPRQLTRGAARVLRREWALDSSRARAELGHEPRSLEAVVRDTLDALERQGVLPGGTLRGAEAVR